MALSLKLRARALSAATEQQGHLTSLVARLYAIAEGAQVAPEKFLAVRAQFLAGLTEFERAYLRGFWPYRARPKQLLPPRLLPNGQRWAVWLLMAGRGFGKTETGCHVCHDHAADRSDAEVVIVTRSSRATDEAPVLYGRSGLLKSFRPNFKPTYEPSKKLVTWPNGAYAQLFSAEEPDQIRGPNATMAWAEELGAWRAGGSEAWAMVRATMRTKPEEGKRPPFVVVTSTPRRTKLFKALADNVAGNVWVTQGHQRENTALDDDYLADMEAEFGGTRLGRQELGGELLDDVPGALWRLEWFELPGFRCGSPETLSRVVVAVDPAVSSSPDSDETGIVVVGLDADGYYHVLADYSGKMSAETWAAMAVRAYHHHRADVMVAEVNNGGDLVDRNIEACEGSDNVNFRQVRATRGKALRAEPVAALYEKGRFHHAKDAQLDALEAQLVEWSPLADERGKVQKSPDRLDALVWATTELIDGSGVAQGEGGVYGTQGNLDDMPM